MRAAAGSGDSRIAGFGDGDGVTHSCAPSGRPRAVAPPPVINTCGGPHPTPGMHPDTSLKLQPLGVSCEYAGHAAVGCSGAAPGAAFASTKSGPVRPTEPSA